MTDYWVKAVMEDEDPIYIKSYGSIFLFAIERARHKLLEKGINLDKVSKYTTVWKLPNSRSLRII